jgi:hypothetical protein
MDSLAQEIPKYRNEYNKVKEPEVYTIKRIDILKKELELYRKKLTLSLSSSVSTNEKTDGLPDSVKECWLCDGICTCDD